MKIIYIRGTIVGENASGQKKIKLLANNTDGLEFWTDTKSIVTDTISRQATIDALNRFSLGETDAMKLYFRMDNYLKKLSSAEQEIKPISYEDCANAMMMMWIDKVITDGEYNRIMDRLNAQHKAEIWAKQKKIEVEHDI